MILTNEHRIKTIDKIHFRCGLCLFSM